MELLRRMPMGFGVAVFLVLAGVLPSPAVQAQDAVPSSFGGAVPPTFITDPPYMNPDAHVFHIPQCGNHGALQVSLAPPSCPLHYHQYGPHVFGGPYTPIIGVPWYGGIPAINTSPHLPLGPGCGAAGCGPAPR